MSREELRDLQLWLGFLDIAHAGVDLNLLTVREPDSICKTDACTYQIGGYSVRTGRAWRWEVPVELLEEKSINFLEFLASSAGALLAVYEGEVTAGDCHLSVVDNTSSAGWLHKMNFLPPELSAEHEAHYELCSRGLAAVLLENKICLYSQWLAGVKNVVADLLSRDNSMTDEQLTKFIKLHFPAQVPESFHISPLPAEVISVLSALMLTGVQPRGLPSPPREDTTHPGVDGSGSSTAVISSVMNIFKPFLCKRNIASSAPSCSRSGTDTGASPPEDLSLMK